MLPSLHEHVPTLGLVFLARWSQATDLLARIRGADGRNGGAPMSISGVTLHKPPGGPLQPLPPGAAGADKVWYKSSLVRRSDMLGQRRRLLVNARHSWVGDACLARGEDVPSSVPAGGRAPHPPDSPRDCGDYHRGVSATANGNNGFDTHNSHADCLLQATPSSTGAAPEPPA